jgi:hypothetical protein
VHGINTKNAKLPFSCGFILILSSLDLEKVEIFAQMMLDVMNANVDSCIEYSRAE